MVWINDLYSGALGERYLFAELNYFCAHVTSINLVIIHAPAVHASMFENQRQASRFSVFFFTSDVRLNKTLIRKNAQD